MNSSTLRITFVAAVALAVAGCGEKLTYERFQTIRDGDSPEVVESILGKPTMMAIGGQTWAYQDFDRGIIAQIYFQDSQVVGKKWGDAEHGIQGDPAITAPGESSETHMRQIK